MKRPTDSPKPPSRREDAPAPIGGPNRPDDGLDGARRQLRIFKACDLAARSVGALHLEALKQIAAELKRLPAGSGGAR